MNNAKNSVSSVLEKRVEKIIYLANQEVAGLRSKTAAVALGLTAAGTMATGACDQNVDQPTDSNYGDASSAPDSYNKMDSGDGGDAHFDASDAKLEGGDASKDSSIDSSKDGGKDANPDAPATAEDCSKQLQAWAEPNVFSASKPTKLFVDIGEVGSINKISAKIEDEKVDTAAKIIKVIYQNTPLSPGLYNTLWDGTDNAGLPLPPGNYIFSVAVDNDFCGPLGDEVTITLQ